ncbi:hypothetical protein DIURU_000179 [Diutina rugosa]|uniref:Peptidase S54 rhomboid domain-containing protein n=1 Tax=Diutina rugosa TaxID=5481 RepID=A0A642UZG6_DIURU|nr:uncharacterized protein DIURU_000179 [Diutina rugosa]KAA8908390.1 hypothetical protein DIURU_000179 [Diutina rugosa]
MFRLPLSAGLRGSLRAPMRPWTSLRASLVTPLKSAKSPVAPMMAPAAKRQFSTQSWARVRNTWYQYNKHYGRPTSKWQKLLKPFLFTVGFCVATTYGVPVVVNAIPALRRHPKSVVYGIIALNGLVFLAWRVPQLSRFLKRYGLLVKDNVYSVWSLLGSAFSHQEPLHILVNMMVFASFGTTLAQVIGASDFLVMYLNACVVSSFVSLLVPTALAAFTGAAATFGVASLGASGAVFAVVGMFSYLFPKAPIALFFIPIPGGAWFAFLATVGWNVAGVFGKWGNYDYAAHLGGSAVGVFYGWWWKQKQQSARAQRLMWF